VGLPRSAAVRLIKVRSVRLLPSSPVPGKFINRIKFHTPFYCLAALTMADPLSLATAVLALGGAVGQTLKQLQTLRESFTDAPRIIADIENDCRVTKSVLDATVQRLNSDDLPTLQIEDNGDGAVKGVSMEEILRANVAQLKLDIDVLFSELARFNTTRQSKIGSLIQRGRMAWEVPYLTAMHNKILAKQRQFEFVESNLQS
jgi:hypothetical protein